jgi:Family of unknown function (DUF6157)
MKTHSTNYLNTFIEVADDCPASIGEIPPTKGDNKTVANIQFEMINKILTNTLRMMFCSRFLP